MFRVLILFLFFQVSGLSQEGKVANDTVVSIKEPKKFKFLFAFDARRSFVLDRNVKFNGVKIGATYKGKLRFGMGIYEMRNPIRMPGIPVDKVEFPDATDTVFFKFNYSGVFVEPIWYNSKRWQISTPAQLGNGDVVLSYRDTSNTRNVEFFKGTVPVFSTSVAGQYKIWRWLAIGSGFGYRFILVKENDIKKSVSAPFYNLSVKVLLGELYKMAFKKEELEEW